MPDLKKVIRELEKEVAEGSVPCKPKGYMFPFKLIEDALSLLKAQEPRVLQIKEMAFLEIAVFIETNGDLEGKGTDLFLAIPYIYAVSQNMLDGYIAFVDGNTDVYDLQAIDYGKLWRCWSARPTEEQREAVKWND